MRKIILILMILLFVGAIPCNRPNMGENMVSPLRITNSFAADDKKSLEIKARAALNNLIDFYSKKDTDNFIALVDLNFSDSRGYSCADLAAALKYDFRSFDDIRLYITGIKEQIVSKDGREVNIIAEWNRALIVASTAQIWMSRGTTNFTFIKAKVGNGRDYPLRLKAITGDLFFGLADFDGIITLSCGTLDGQAITVSRQIKEGKFIN